MLTRRNLAQILLNRVYRLCAVILAITFLLVGSGAAAHVHNALHAIADAAHEGHDHPPPAEGPKHHDATNCAVHAQLATPLLGAQWVTLLVLLGLFVAFLTLLSPQPISHRPPLRLTCRGPPDSPAHPVA